MWFFRSPQIIFGEDALSYLEQVKGRRAFIVTDEIMVKLGFVDLVKKHLEPGGIEVQVFSDVEPEPCLETVQQAAQLMQTAQPDWVIALGGGSCMDAAKTAWFLYERPDVDLESMNPMESYGLRSKARLITIPTTAGSGSEVSQAAVIKDTAARRKMELASYEIIADLTIVDPRFSGQMPRQLTADTGVDVLTHAVEAYNNNWSNDFSDGLCLQATKMVFQYLPRAVQYGADDPEAREKMANAATIAGLVICNSNISLAHALGHSLGAIFSIPHGRVTGLLLPLTVEYTTNGGLGRYLDLVQIIGECAENEVEAGSVFANAIRSLIRKAGQPLSLKEAGIPAKEFLDELESVIDRTEMDLGLVMSRRYPDRDEIRRLFLYAYEGKPVDF